MPSAALMTIEGGSDYQKYRGKCKELSEAAAAADRNLRLVRGWYYCPIWGKQEHWWNERADGTILDLTKDQFPSKGIGEYVEFNGYYQCEECGKAVSEEDAVICGNYVVCSNRCAMRLVGL